MHFKRTKILFWKTTDNLDSFYTPCDSLTPKSKEFRGQARNPRISNKFIWCQKWPQNRVFWKIAKLVKKWPKFQKIVNFSSKFFHHVRKEFVKCIFCDFYGSPTYGTYLFCCAKKFLEKHRKLRLRAVLNFASLCTENFFGTCTFKVSRTNFPPRTTWCTT